MATINLPWNQRAVNQQCTPISDAINETCDNAAAELTVTLGIFRRLGSLYQNVLDAVERKVEHQWPQ